MGNDTNKKEHLLVIFYQDLLEGIRDVVEQKFPNANLTIYRLGRAAVPKDILAKVTVVCTFGYFPDPSDVPNLKLVHFFNAGIDHALGQPLIAQTTIPITNSAGVAGPPMAEWTVMNWLTAAKGYDHMREAQRQHRWDRSTQYINVHDQVGKHVGILGYGSIGRQIGRLASALGMTVHAYTATSRVTPLSRKDTSFIIPGTGDPEGSVPSSWHHGTDKASLHDFLALSLDHLVILLPRTPQTWHLLGVEEFKILSDNCSAKNSGRRPFVTSISRGSVIDQEALVAALKSGQLSGAALDVTDPEPLPPDNELWDMPNVHISPHMSAVGVEYIPRSLDVLKMNIERLEKGEALINEFTRGKWH
ncbi:dehydrogenase, putative [Talaromyces stipitatus ATCC 10500]|uniref:Dehydrogenase, putative n=1 Tax=Talaromyces stipitatus (strain ATCC 10500 / CBS 375.48 / QM 6759 / NRRL 1006) TaxID=441959 RepID=B8LV96_TALSN|nr:dehydrogenase, putative [Talaromyces stipitatus ATCC 10500]EED23146.1 dehydrogenase, putative [Talaromyces stipitatus ATCC 10500]